MALGSEAAATRAAADTGPAGASAPPSAQAPEELIEIQLRGILESTQTSAGAVCLFDQHQELLRLAVEIGLSDEGCRRLRSVRRGGATTWDMPLHSLLNRRVYLIESAAKNRYVPPLVDDVAMVRAVACIPLYDGSTPVGSLILVALAPRSFGERQIRMLEQPARELVGSIVTMRKRVTVAGPVRAGRPSLSAAGTSPAAVPVAGPTQPGVKTAPGAITAPSASIQVAVDRARAELERLRGRLSEAEDTATKERARADEHAQHLRELQSRTSELQAERERLSETLAARTHECEVLQDRVTAAEETLAEARAVEAGVRAELEHVRTASTTAAESEASAAVGALEARIAELESTNQHLRERTAELEAAEHAARAAAERQVADAGVAADTRLAAATQASERAERRAAELTAELDALRGEAAAARAAHEHALDDAERRHASALDELQARGAAAEQAALDAQRRCEALEAELATTRAAAGSQQDHAEALTQERAHWEAERAAAHEREVALAARVEQLQAELDRTRREDSQLRDGFAHLESLIQTGVEDGTAPTNAGTVDLSDASSFEVVELDETNAGGDDGGATGGLDVDALVIEELESSPPTGEAATPAAAATSADGILVIDTETNWAQAAPPGTTIHVAAPDAIARATPPAQILVNLAAPNALGALGTLRANGVSAPCVAFIGVAGQPRALLVGRLELSARPIDPDALLSGLAGRFARGTRVVTAGADVDGLISLRQALARLGVSVSMAWDAKQAGDLLAMVHPDVAIIDLELPPKDGCALVARMALVQPSPLTVVIPKPGDSASAFATAVVHPELSRMTLPAKELLTRAIALMTAAPAARR
jgi:CheY-like chemotaxis protein